MKPNPGLPAEHPDEAAPEDTQHTHILVFSLSP